MPAWEAEIAQALSRPIFLADLADHVPGQTRLDAAFDDDRLMPAESSSGGRALGKLPALEELIDAAIESIGTPVETFSNVKNEKRSRGRDIVRARLGIGAPAVVTLETLGQARNVSRERIRQLEADALELLRKALLIASPASTDGEDECRI